MKYNGLLVDHQQEHVHSPLPSWQYGEIRDGRKVIDPILQYGCYVLGYNNQEILDFVADTVKSNKPEIGETYMPKAKEVRLNHISFDFADKIHNISGMKPFFALSGSDSNEGAVKLASAYHFQKGNLHKKTIVGFEKSYCREVSGNFSKTRTASRLSTQPSRASSSLSARSPFTDRGLFMFQNWRQGKWKRWLHEMHLGGRRYK